MTGNEATRSAEARAGRVSLGMVGLGNLGMPMALAAIDAGWAVTVFDKREDRVAECAAAGGHAASGLAELAGCEIVAVVVTDDAAVTEVLAGSGLLDALGDSTGDSAVAVHSTILPATAQKLGELAGRAGVRVVDAPVSGGADRARNGTLALFAGGSTAAIGQLSGYFKTIASSVVRAGDVGAGGTPLHYRPWSKDLWDVIASAREHDLRLPVAGLLAQLMPAYVEDHAAAARPARGAVR